MIAGKWGGIISNERIMIVEDERIVAEEIRQMLSSMGYIVTGIVSTGPDAIRTAGEQMPDLVLMDIRLKGEMDGIEAAGVIMERHSIPAIYLTAYSDESTVQRAKLTRPLGYIIKPLDRAQVRSVIEVALYRYRRERTLIESEKWLSATLKTIENGIIATTGSGEIHYMNPAACMLTGVSIYQANGKQIDDIVSVVDFNGQGKIPCFFNKIIAEKPTHPKKGSAILASGDGYEIPVNYVVSPFREEIGQGPGFIVIIHDISRRLKIEDMLHNSEKDYRSFIDAAGEGIINLDHGHRVQFVNPRVVDMLGYPKSQLIGQSVFRLMDTDSGRDLLAKLSSMDSSPVVKYELELKKFDGTGLWVMMAINKMKDLEGNYSGAVAMVSDISGRKAIESKLTEARAQTELYLDLIEKEIGKMNQLFKGYLDMTDEMLE